jgi:hypothetical protein
VLAAVPKAIVARLTDFFGSRFIEMMLLLQSLMNSSRRIQHHISHGHCHYHHPHCLAQGKLTLPAVAARVTWFFCSRGDETVKLIR